MRYPTFMVRPIFLLCFSMLLISSIACNGQGEEFINQDRGFAFTIPEGWKKGGPSEENPNLSASIYLSQKNPAEHITVEVSDVKMGITFKFKSKEIPQSVADELKKFNPRVVIGKPERTEVGGYPAWKLIAENDQAGAKERLSIWIILFRDQLYFIRSLDSDKSSHPDDVKVVLESFHFIDDPHEGYEQKNSILGTAILASKGWLAVPVEEKKRSGMFLFIPSDDFEETFTLDVVPASTNAKKMFLGDRYLSLLRDSLRATNPSLKMLSGGRLEIDGVKAWTYKTDEKIDGKTVHGQYWQVINNDRVYTMTWKYLDGSTREPQVERMVQSFRFVTPTR